MHKVKPLVMGHRPWWRHPIFPWGWYSLSIDFIHNVIGYQFNMANSGDDKNAVESMDQVSEAVILLRQKNGAIEVNFFRSKG